MKAMPLASSCGEPPWEQTDIRLLALASQATGVWGRAWGKEEDKVVLKFWLIYLYSAEIVSLLTSAELRIMDSRICIRVSCSTRAEGRGTAAECDSDGKVSKIADESSIRVR